MLAPNISATSFSTVINFSIFSLYFFATMATITHNESSSFENHAITPVYPLSLSIVYVCCAP